MLSIDRAKYDPERKRENVSVNEVICECIQFAHF